ncbi:MAG: hypothetical protein OZ948_19255 [Deltaproteobacteria bacterium]|nr:hypothetical protein [Deltaproteobacteria bacterium]
MSAAAAARPGAGPPDSPRRQGTAGEPQFAVHPGKVTRRKVWFLLGAPSDQSGSVNDPRTHEEQGLRWNEKWVYVEDREVVRVVLWNRYDFLGAFRVRRDGSLEPEPLPG